MELWNLLLEHKKGDLSYNDSVALFFQIYPEKEISLKSFLETEDDHSWKRVKKGLDEKIHELEVNQVQNKFRDVTHSVYKDNPINPELLPLELRKEYSDDRPALFRERSQLHARLELVKDQQKRYEMADRIVTLTAQIRAIHNKVDEFMASGKVLKKEIVKREPVDPTKLKNFEIENEIRLLMSRRSKAKDKPEKLEEFNELERQIKELRDKRYVG